MENNPNMNELLDWDSTISVDSEDRPKYTLLPEGEYNFTITNREFGTYEGQSDKLPVGCKYIRLTLDVENPDGDPVQVQDTLYMIKRNEWRFGDVLRAVGLRKHGEPVKLNMFQNIVGAKGVVRLKPRKGTNNNNMYNNVDRYIIGAQFTETKEASPWG